MYSNQLLYLRTKSGVKSDLPESFKNKSVFMTGKVLYILLILSLMLISCNGRIPKPADIIPEKDLIPILTEIHIADGLLPNPKVRNRVLSVDTISTYHYIAESHGYTKDALDRTMHFYFVRKPKKLIRIYDNILGTLSEMESLLEKEVMLAREQSSNMWPGERNYYFPDQAGTESVAFELSLAGGRAYTLSFTATLYPYDQSVNPRTSAFIVNADSVNNGKRTYFETPPYIKDGKSHTYSLRIFEPAGTPFRLKGTLYKTDNNPEEWQRHVRFDNITLSIPVSDI